MAGLIDTNKGLTAGPALTQEPALAASTGLWNGGETPIGGYTPTYYIYGF